MRKLLSTIVAAGALAVAAAAATPAAAIDFDGTFDVTNYNTDPGQFGGLVINVSPESGSVIFPLSTVGESTDWLPLFQISTPENSIDFDDFFLPQPIEVTFSFTSPGNFGGDVDGSTWGYINIFGVKKGAVVWEGSQFLPFGDTGVLKVDLNNGDWRINKSQQISAKFTLESLPSAVPEPGTWALMITGFGLAGAALRRQRKLAMTAA